jgi:hypothetical protein
MEKVVGKVYFPKHNLCKINCEKDYVAEKIHFEQYLDWKRIILANEKRYFRRNPTENNHQIKRDKTQTANKFIRTF